MRLLNIGVILLLIIGLVSFRSNVNAQTIPFTLSKIGNPSERVVTAEIQEHYYRSELTPQVLVQPNGKRLYLFSSSFSYVCESDKNMLIEDVIIPKSNCKFISKANYIKNITIDGSFEYEDSRLTIDPNWKTWKMTYDGIITFHLVDIGNNNYRLINVRHGEQANSRSGDGMHQPITKYQNMLYPTVPIEGYFKSPWTGTEYLDGCWSGYKPDENGNNVYQHCWESFNSFTTLSWLKYDPTIGFDSLEGINGNKPTLTPQSTEYAFDEGPIMWPQPGYMAQDGLPNYDALYGASSYIQGTNYIYSFAPNRWCLRIARAPLAQGGRYDTWEFLYNNTFSTSSLPAGYVLNNVFSSPEEDVNRDCIPLDNNFSIPGFPDAKVQSFNTQYFQVATLKRQGFPIYYVATAETEFEICENSQTCEPNETVTYSGYGIRLSSDLIHWSPAVYYSIVKSAWGVGGGKYSYPTFVNKEGTSNYEVDAENFYILGKNADNGADPINGYQNNLINLRLECTKPARVGSVDVNGYSTGIVPYKEKAEATWSNAANATKYAYRLDVLNEGSGHCVDSNDMCKDNETSRLVNLKLDPGKRYAFWVHSVGYCDHWSDWGDANLIEFNFANKGDVNLDGKTTVADYVLFANALFLSSTNTAVFDVTADDKINLLDFVKSF